MPRYILGPLCAAFVCACSSAPRLHQPDRIEAYCGDRAAISTAIESIVASTGDGAERFPTPSDAQIRKLVKANGGIIAHWNDQALHSPAVAKTLGLGGTYVTIGDAAIPDQPAKGDSRQVYLTVKTGHGPQTFALKAYDVQDVCNEGKLRS